MMMRIVLSKKFICMFIGIIFLMLFLHGCSDRYKENKRIWIKAKYVAEKRAVEYIHKKYGIEATPLGYNTQGRQSVFSWYANTNVLVYMSYEDELFTVGIDVDDKNILSDNRQSTEICDVLMKYLLDIYDLPDSERSKIKFRVKGIPVYEVPWKSEYSADNLVNFIFENQTAEELLEQIEDITYLCQYFDLSGSLETIELDPDNWPKHEDFRVVVKMILCNDKDSDLSFDFSNEPSFLEKKHLQEWMYTSVNYGNYEELGKPDIKKNFYFYQLNTVDGLVFITQLPYKPMDIYEQDYKIEVSDEELVWEEKHTMADKSTMIVEYEQVSKLFEEIDLFTTRCSTQLIIPDEFAKKFENELYLGNFDKESGKIIVERVYRNGEWEWSEADRNEQRSRIVQMVLGHQYALLKKTAEYTIPVSSDES